MSKRDLLKRLAISVVPLSIMTPMNITSGHAADDATIKALKEKLVLANKILDMEGLARPMGHISVRIPKTDTFLISRNIAPGNVASIDDIVMCNLDGKVIQGKYPTYGEITGHAMVYKMRQDLSSVAHTHSAAVIALSMTGTTLLLASNQAMKLHSMKFDTPMTLFGAGHLQKPELCEKVVEGLGPNFAVILKGHGALIVGRSLEECVVNACDIETAARYQIMASSAGKVLPFDRSELDALADFKVRVAKQGGDWKEIGTGSSTGRGWEYYTSKVKKG
ncbi:MAG: class II aldolase/adducin family protein [Deltaproteobacteria bacterium]